MTNETDQSGATSPPVFDPELLTRPAHLTGTGPAPVFAIERERLTFVLDGVTVHVKLDDLVKGAVIGHSPIALLLYAVVLKLHDVDLSLRKALKLSEDQIARVSTTLGPDEVIGAVVRHLKDLGLPIPGKGGSPS